MDVPVDLLDMYVLRILRGRERNCRMAVGRELSNEVSPLSPSLPYLNAIFAWMLSDPNRTSSGSSLLVPCERFVIRVVTR